MIRLNILWVIKVVVHIVLIIILEKSEFIHKILYLLKYQSVVNKNKIGYFCNKFLEKGLNESKSNTSYF